MIAPTAVSPRRDQRLTWATRARATLRLTGNALALLAMLVLLGLAIGPHLFDYRTVVMRTGSMEPLISPGDVVVIRPEALSRLAAGQILTFAAPVPGSPVFSHRVTSVRRTGTDAVVTTKGDANPVADPWQARITDQRVWHVVRVVPGVGWVIGALHRPSVHLVSVWLIPLVLCAEILLRLWRRPTATPSSPTLAKCPGS